MKRKLFLFTVLIIAVLLSAGIPSSAANLQRQSGMKIKTIYLDPAYGGEEKGPRIENQHGKDITLKIAQELQKLLRTQGFTVPLSRTGGQLVTLDQRSFQAKSKRSDIFVSLKVTSRQTDCVRIVIAKNKKIEYQQSGSGKLKDLDSDVDYILTSLKLESAHQESRALSKKIAGKLKSDQILGCVRELSGNDYVLMNTVLPAVIIDLGVSKAAKNPYVLDPSSFDKIVRSLAEAIKEYTGERSADQVRRNEN